MSNLQENKKKFLIIVSPFSMFICIHAVWQSGRDQIEEFELKVVFIILDDEPLTFATITYVNSISEQLFLDLK